MAAWAHQHDVLPQHLTLGSRLLRLSQWNVLLALEESFSSEGSWAFGPVVPGSSWNQVDAGKL